MEADKKQKRQRRSFSDEFKAGAVRLVLNERKLPAAVARDLDLSHSLVTKWVEQAQADLGRSTVSHRHGCVSGRRWGSRLGTGAERRGVTAAV